MRATNAICFGVSSILLGLLIAGCASTTAHTEENCLEVKPGVITSVNTSCVIVNSHPVDPAVTPVVHKGQKVGFCCAGCVPKFKAMSDSEKDTAIANALSAR